MIKTQSDYNQYYFQSIINPAQSRNGMTQSVWIMYDSQPKVNPSQLAQSGYNPDRSPAIEFEVSIRPQSLIDVDNVGLSSWETSILTTQSWQSGIIL
jgi:hypothetical protein